ncbi:DUF881 domain-containing protein [Alicyclobacillus cycloheptanicus]|nr:DUF881 domain-containing protein [Alicyclobacillus cycloheptanicus]
MLTVQLTSRQQPSSTTLSSYLDYRTQVDEQVEEHTILMQDIAKEKAQLAQFEASGGNQQEMQAVLKKDAQTVAAQAGLTPVTGPGITITIQDDPSLPFYPETAGAFAQNADVEISQIVNDLFGNGATAISINGNRLVTTSSIRLVSGLGPGTELQVNTEPVVEPYVITAVGNVSEMQSILTVDDVKPSLNLMQEDCIVKAYNKPHTVTVPAYQGPLPGTWAKEVDNG